MTAKAERPLIVIAGPTASGKSGAALAIAERCGAEILSCDSVAVYRGFDIGAAKPSRADRVRVRHHLIDVAAPEEGFTAARFAELAGWAIEDCRRRKVPVIVSGGTALYLAALLNGLFEAPPPDMALRAALHDQAEQVGWPALHARLASIDPIAAARIHPNDPIRIERALEIHAQTGVTISQHHALHAQRGPRHASRLFVIDPPSATLDARIALRVDQMLAAGLIDETEELVAQHGRHLKALGAVGYKQALVHLDARADPSHQRNDTGQAEADESGLDSLARSIRTATRRFAKRQLTFFRKAWPPSRTTHWVAAAESLLAGEIGTMIERLLEEERHD